MLTQNSNSNIDKLQKVQNFAGRIILRLRKYDYFSDELRLLKWHPTREKLILNDATMMRKCIINLVPDYLADMFKLHSQVHNRQTRSSSSLNSVSCPWRESTTRPFRNSSVVQCFNFPFPIQLIKKPYDCRALFDSKIRLFTFLCMYVHMTGEVKRVGAWTRTTKVWACTTCFAQEKMCWPCVVKKWVTVNYYGFRKGNTWTLFLFCKRHPAANFVLYSD